MFCIIGVSVVYAALSATLNISGTADVGGAEWSLEVTKFSPYDIEYDGYYTCDPVVCMDFYTYFGDAKLLSEPIISGTKISDFEISVTKPSDFIYLLFKVTNTGSIPAVFSSVMNSTPVIESIINNTSDVEWGNSNIVYYSSVWQKDSVTLAVENDVMCSGDYLLFDVVLGVNDSVSIPSDSLVISNLNSEILFVQGDSSLCSDN